MEAVERERTERSWVTRRRARFPDKHAAGILGGGPVFWTDAAGLFSGGSGSGQAQLSPAAGQVFAWPQPQRSSLVVIAGSPSPRSLPTPPCNGELPVFQGRPSDRHAPNLRLDDDGGPVKRIPVPRTRIPRYLGATVPTLSEPEIVPRAPGEVAEATRERILAALRNSSQSLSSTVRTKWQDPVTRRMARVRDNVARESPSNLLQAYLAESQDANKTGDGRGKQAGNGVTVTASAKVRPNGDLWFNSTENLGKPQQFILGGEGLSTKYQGRVLLLAYDSETGLWLCKRDHFNRGQQSSEPAFDPGAGSQ
ncbi:hypothetical protein C8R46DRAFT_1026576 [Mycena filopes]|nr:hypothetical protein C8R46DRAFT_1026576 [Mycena filopes]